MIGHEFSMTLRDDPAGREHEVHAYEPVERMVEDAGSANILARHVFAQRADGVASIDYAIQYRLADGFAGGDIADVYEFDNNSVSLMVADVEGRGVGAAQLATLIKFSLRAFASAGMTAEATMMNLNRVYLENCAFEKIESFASVFFALVDSERRTMGYCSAGHDIALLMRPDEGPVMLPVTAPVVGVLRDRHELFTQRYMEIVPRTTLVVATDGVTEARNKGGELFGNECFEKSAERARSRSMTDLAKAVIDDALAFSSGSLTDDLAVLAARFY